MFFIRQGATHKVVLGPAVAVGDGFTPVTNLVIGNADEAEAIKHDDGTVVDISGYTLNAIATADAYYHLTLHNDISGTVGHLTIVINDDSLILPLRADFTVLDTAAYDAMYKDGAEGPLQATTVGRKLTVESDGVGHADVKELAGSAVQQASGYVKVSDGTGTGQIALASGKVDVSHLAGSAIQQSGGYTKVSAGTGTGQLSLSSGVIESDMVKIRGAADAAAILMAKLYGYQSDAVVLVANGATDVARGANLRTAYTAAKALTPGGNALATNNRGMLLIPAGRYDFVLGDGGNNGLVVDGAYVDLIGLLGEPDDVVLTSQIATACKGTVQQTAGDVRFRHITIDIEAASSGGSDATKNSAYFPASNLPATVHTNCKYTTQSGFAQAMRVGIVYSGKYTDCECPAGFGFGGGVGGVGTASGTFTNCTAANDSFGGGSGTASGTFIDCTAEGDSFGGDAGTASGTFTNCTAAGGDSFGGNGGTASGTFTNCAGASGGFGGVRGTASGVFVNCRDGSDSFGGDSGTASGVFIGCVGGSGSFEVGGAGLYINCSRNGALLDNSDKAVQLSTQGKTDVNAEVAARLNTAIPGGPTADSINERVKAIDVLTEASGGGDLAANLTNTNRLTAVRAAILTDWIDGERLDALLDLVKAKTDNLPSGLPKNVALADFPFLMVDSNDHFSPKTGLTVTAQISKDGGAFAACANPVTEMAYGFYKISFTQAERNADRSAWKFSATGADQRSMTVISDT